MKITAVSVGVGCLLLVVTSGCAGVLGGKTSKEAAPDQGQVILSASPDLSSPTSSFSSPPIYGKLVFAGGATADSLWGCPKARNGEPQELTVSVAIDGRVGYYHRFSPTSEQCQASELELPLLPAAGSAHDNAATGKLVDLLIERAGGGPHQIGLSINAGKNPKLGPFIATSVTMDLGDTAAWKRYRDQVAESAVAGRRLPQGLTDPKLVAEFKAGLKKTSYEGAFEVVVIQDWEIIRDPRNTPMRKVLRGVVAYRDKAPGGCFMRRGDLYREFNGAAYEPAKLVVEGGFLPEEISCP